MNKKYTLEEALALIDELEKKCAFLENKCTVLEEKLHSYQSKQPVGRKKHDAKWRKTYESFVKLYEDGMPMEQIIRSSDFSRRTAYRYKAFYEESKAAEKKQ